MVRRNNIEAVIERYKSFEDVKNTIKLFMKYKKAKLMYGSEDIDNGAKREWYEAWNRGRGIVLQRYTGHPWFLFIIEGDVVRVSSRYWNDLTDALTFLRKELGINAEV